MKQKFRSENEKFKAKQEEIRKKEMSVAELNAELTATNKDMAKRIAKYEERDEAEKMDLLNKLPDKDREEFSDLPLSKIKLIVARLTQASPDTLKGVHGAVKPVKIDKPYSQMNDQERRAYFNQLQNQR